ncbi:uncharacterized protein LOC131160001 isoform X2 [Malania oleifera]|uniref:uncharacterized protein LOC131160001 isoform X2 n=1 Tax=Malania oleifera TaxID=397392 RepID=UPI0025AE651A|nr:uncharacterized protein LOC131160001 isoform X2 [Malania oleifera]
MKSDYHSMDSGSEVFVGGLARAVTESKIHEVFASCGEIMEIRLMKDQHGNSKGYCFVRFTMKEAADKAIKEKSNFLLEGKKIGVLPSTDQNSLFLGNLRKDWSADEFEKMVHQVFEDVVSVDLAMPLSNGSVPAGQKQQNRGFAFIEFSSHAAAARAYRMGSKLDFLLGGSWHPVVQWTKEEPEIDPEELAKTKVAFVRNLPTDADEDYLEKLFEPFGKLEKVVLSRKGHSCAGFVHFAKRSDLENAIKEMNEKTVQGQKGGMTFKLQVAIAKPFDKRGKRARDESEAKPKNLSISKHLKADPVSNTSGRLTSTGLKLKHSIEEPDATDPYEAAFVSLPFAVKERLFRIFRLGIGTRFDIDIQSITSLNELPESAAISVLDQFMLSGADRANKGAYLAGLISKHQINKLRLNSSTLLLPRSGDFASVEPLLPRISERVHLLPVDPLAPRVGATATRYDSYRASQMISPYSSSDSDPPFSHFMRFGQEISPAPLHQTRYPATYGKDGLDPPFTASAHYHLPARSQVRFDPFTGEPYKFDPFTGEPIQTESLPRHSGSRY